MIKLRVSSPYYETWVFEVDAVPRLGEYVQVDGALFLVTEIRHVLYQNEVRIGLKNVDP